jgi:hypothetical protein
MNTESMYKKIGKYSFYLAFMVFLNLSMPVHGTFNSTEDASAKSNDTIIEAVDEKGNPISGVPRTSVNIVDTPPPSSASSSDPIESPAAPQPSSGPNPAPSVPIEANLEEAGDNDSSAPSSASTSSPSDPAPKEVTPPERSFPPVNLSPPSEPSPETTPSSSAPTNTVFNNVTLGGPTNAENFGHPFNIDEHIVPDNAQPITFDEAFGGLVRLEPQPDSQLHPQPDSGPAPNTQAPANTQSSSQARFGALGAIQQFGARLLDYAGFGPQHKQRYAIQSAPTNPSDFDAPILDPRLLSLDMAPLHIRVSPTTDAQGNPIFTLTVTCEDQKNTKTLSADTSNFGTIYFPVKQLLSPDAAPNMAYTLSPDGTLTIYSLNNAQKKSITLESPHKIVLDQQFTLDNTHASLTIDTPHLVNHGICDFTSLTSCLFFTGETFENAPTGLWRAGEVKFGPTLQSVHNKGTLIARKDLTIHFANQEGSLINDGVLATRQNLLCRAGLINSETGVIIADRIGLSASQQLLCSGGYVVSTGQTNFKAPLVTVNGLTQDTNYLPQQLSACGPLSIQCDTLAGEGTSIQGFSDVAIWCNKDLRLKKAPTSQHLTIQTHSHVNEANRTFLTNLLDDNSYKDHIRRVAATHPKWGIYGPTVLIQVGHKLMSEARLMASAAYQIDQADDLYENGPIDPAAIGRLTLKVKDSATIKAPVQADAEIMITAHTLDNHSTIQAPRVGIDLPLYHKADNLHRPTFFNWGHHQPDDITPALQTANFVDTPNITRVTNKGEIKGETELQILSNQIDNQGLISCKDPHALVPITPEEAANTSGSINLFGQKITAGQLDATGPVSIDALQGRLTNTINSASLFVCVEDFDQPIKHALTSSTDLLFYVNKLYLNPRGSLNGQALEINASHATDLHSRGLRIKDLINLMAKTLSLSGPQSPTTNSLSLEADTSLNVMCPLMLEGTLQVRTPGTAGLTQTITTKAGVALICNTLNKLATVNTNVLQARVGTVHPNALTGQYKATKNFDFVAGGNLTFHNSITSPNLRLVARRQALLPGLNTHTTRHPEGHLTLNGAITTTNTDLPAVFFGQDHITIDRNANITIGGNSLWRTFTLDTDPIGTYLSSADPQPLTPALRQARSTSITLRGSVNTKRTIDLTTGQLMLSPANNQAITTQISAKKAFLKVLGDTNLIHNPAAPRHTQPKITTESLLQITSAGNLTSNAHLATKHIMHIQTKGKQTYQDHAVIQGPETPKTRKEYAFFAWGYAPEQLDEDNPNRILLHADDDLTTGGTVSLGHGLIQCKTEKNLTQNATITHTGEGTVHVHANGETALKKPINAPQAKISVLGPNNITQTPEASVDGQSAVLATDSQLTQNAPVTTDGTLQIFTKQDFTQNAPLTNTGTGETRLQTTGKTTLNAPLNSETADVIIVTNLDLTQLGAITANNLHITTDGNYTKNASLMTHGDTTYISAGKSFNNNQPLTAHKNLICKTGQSMTSSGAISGEGLMVFQIDGSLNSNAGITHREQTYQPCTASNGLWTDTTKPSTYLAFDIKGHTSLNGSVRAPNVLCILNTQSLTQNGSLTLGQLQSNVANATVFNSPLTIIHGLLHLTTGHFSVQSTISTKGHICLIAESSGQSDVSNANLKSQNASVIMATAAGLRIFVSNINANNGRIHMAIGGHLWIGGKFEPCWRCFVRNCKIHDEGRAGFGRWSETFSWRHRICCGYNDNIFHEYYNNNRNCSMRGILFEYDHGNPYASLPSIINRISSKHRGNVDRFLYYRYNPYDPVYPQVVRNIQKMDRFTGKKHTYFSNLTAQDIYGIAHTLTDTAFANIYGTRTDAKLISTHGPLINHGSVRANRYVVLRALRSYIINSGEVWAGKDILIEALNNILNTGPANANRNTTVTSHQGGVTNTSQLTAGNHLAIKSKLSIKNTETGDIVGQSATTLHSTDGNVSNSGTIDTPAGQTSVLAKNLYNNADAHLKGKNLYVKVDGTFHNLGYVTVQNDALVKCRNYVSEDGLTTSHYRGQQNRFARGQAQFTAGNDIKIDATQGIQLIGAHITAGGNLDLSAVTGIDLQSLRGQRVICISKGNFWKRSKYGTKPIFYPSTLQGKRVRVQSDGIITIEGSNIIAEDELVMIAKDFMDIKSAQAMYVKENSCSFTGTGWKRRYEEDWVVCKTNIVCANGDTRLFVTNGGLDITGAVTIAGFFVDIQADGPVNVKAVELEVNNIYGYTGLNGPSFTSMTREYSDNSILMPIIQGVTNINVTSTKNNINIRSAVVKCLGAIKLHAGGDINISYEQVHNYVREKGISFGIAGPISDGLKALQSLAQNDGEAAMGYLRHMAGGAIPCLDNITRTVESKTGQQLAVNTAKTLVEAYKFLSSAMTNGFGNAMLGRAGISNGSFRPKLELSYYETEHETAMAMCTVLAAQEVFMTAQNINLDGVQITNPNGGPLKTIDLKAQKSIKIQDAKSTIKSSNSSTTFGFDTATMTPSAGHAEGESSSTNYHGAQYAAETVNMNAPNIDLTNTQIIAGEVDIEAEWLRILTHQSQSEGFQTSVGAGLNFGGPDSFHAAHQEHESRQAPLQPGIRARSGRVKARSARLQGAFIDIEDGEFEVEDLTFEEVKNFVNQWGFSLGLSGMQSAIHGTDDSGIAGDFDFGFDWVDRQQVNRPTVSERTRLISNCNIQGLNRCILNAQETIRDRQVHMRIWVPLRVDTQKVQNNLNEMGNYIAEALATCKKIEAEADDPAIRQAAKDLAESMESAKKDKPDADDDEIAEDVNRNQALRNLRDNLAKETGEQAEDTTETITDRAKNEPIDPAYAEPEARVMGQLDPESGGLFYDMAPEITATFEGVTTEQRLEAEGDFVASISLLTGTEQTPETVRACFETSRNLQRLYLAAMAAEHVGKTAGKNSAETQNYCDEIRGYAIKQAVSELQKNGVIFTNAVFTPDDDVDFENCSAALLGMAIRALPAIMRSAGRTTVGRRSATQLIREAIRYFTGGRSTVNEDLTSDDAGSKVDEKAESSAGVAFGMPDPGNAGDEPPKRDDKDEKKEEPEEPVGESEAAESGGPSVPSTRAGNRQFQQARAQRQARQSRANARRNADESAQETTVHSGRSRTEETVVRANRAGRAAESEPVVQPSGRGAVGRSGNAGSQSGGSSNASGTGSTGTKAEPAVQPEGDPRTWNEYQSNTSGQHGSRSEAASGWQQYRADNNLNPPAPEQPSVAPGVAATRVRLNNLSGRTFQNIIHIARGSRANNKIFSVRLANGRTVRVKPDEICARDGVCEFKNQAEIYASTQLQAEAQLAKMMDKPMTLIVGKGSRVNQPVKDLIERVNGKILRFDPKNGFTPY